LGLERAFIPCRKFVKNSFDVFFKTRFETSFGKFSSRTQNFFLQNSTFRKLTKKQKSFFVEVFLKTFCDFVFKIGFETSFGKFSLNYQSFEASEGFEPLQHKLSKKTVFDFFRFWGFQASFDIFFERETPSPPNSERVSEIFWIFKKPLPPPKKKGAAPPFEQNNKTHRHPQIY
jgi:hypothetical protein